MISEEEFESKYNAVSNADESDLIETGDDESLKAALKQVLPNLSGVIDALVFTEKNMGASIEHAEQIIKHVWTVTEAEEDMYADGGFHFVNRMGYVVTEKPWEVGNDSAEYFIRLHPVLDTDSDDVIKAKLDEAVDREMDDYIRDNFLSKDRMIPEIEAMAESNEELTELLSEHQSSSSPS